MSTQSTQSVPAARPVNPIATPIDKRVAGGLAINHKAGGFDFDNLDGVMELAKLMAVSQQSVPKHCRNQPGVCLGIVIQSIEWRMSPYAVARKSYVVNDVLSYESQLIHAVVEQRAPIKHRLRHEYIGEGGKRRCKIWATPKDEDEPLVYISPEFDKIQPKNSPLWKTKPDLQLFYNASRDWARMYYPDVIMGVYSEDELLDSMPGSQAIEHAPVGGVAALKSRVIGSSTSEVEQHEVEEEFTGTTDGEGGDEEYVDVNDEQESPEPSSDSPQGMGDPQGMTPEEEAERQREQSDSGQLFAKHPNTGK